MTAEEYVRATLGDLMLTIAQLRAELDKLKAERELANKALEESMKNG